MSRIDDGVCDCCDGRDETILECENRCTSILENQQEQKRRLTETLTQGRKEKSGMIKQALSMATDRAVKYQHRTSLLKKLIQYRDLDLRQRLHIETLIERHEHGMCAWNARTNSTCELERDETQCPNAAWSKVETSSLEKKSKKKRTFSSLWNSLTSYDYEARIQHHIQRLERKQWDDLVKRANPEHVIDAIREIRFRVPMSEDKCQNVTVGDILVTNTSFRTNNQVSSVGYTYPWRAGPRYSDSSALFHSFFQIVLHNSRHSCTKVL